MRNKRHLYEMSILGKSFSQIPFVGREAPMPDDPPEPRVQDTSHITTCQLLSSWRRVENADTGLVCVRSRALCVGDRARHLDSSSDTVHWTRDVDT